MADDRWFSQGIAAQYTMQNPPEQLYPPIRAAQPQMLFPCFSTASRPSLFGTNPRLKSQGACWFVFQGFPAALSEKCEIAGRIPLPVDPHQ